MLMLSCLVFLRCDASECCVSDVLHGWSVPHDVWIFTILTKSTTNRTLCAWFSDRAVLALCIDSCACASRTSGHKGLEAAVSS